MEPWSGIADADAFLGRTVPLPAVPLPLVRWVEIRPVGADGVEIEWNLDDTRAGSPGRLALFAGRSAPDERPWDVEVERVAVGGATAEHRVLPLEEAEPPLRPAHELRWDAAGLHLRLTAQGVWDTGDLLAIAASVQP